MTTWLALLPDPAIGMMAKHKDDGQQLTVDAENRETAIRKLQPHLTRAELRCVWVATQDEYTAWRKQQQQQQRRLA
jgi:hypothetical protein